MPKWKVAKAAKVCLFILHGRYLLRALCPFLSCHVWQDPTVVEWVEVLWTLGCLVAHNDSAARLELGVPPKDHSEAPGPRASRAFRRIDDNGSTKTCHSQGRGGSLH